MGSAPRIPARLVWRNPWHWLAFGFGAGLAPWAPGTFGTLAAVPIYLALRPLPLAAYLALVGLMLLAGVGLCGYSSRTLGVHDHPGIVWDEVVGYLATMAAAPAQWWSPVLGFMLFRVFDIWKPWPVRSVDRRMGGGLGIMLDDLLAAVYAWVALQGLAHWVA